MFENHNAFVFSSFGFYLHHSVYEMEILKYRVNNEYECHRGTSAVEELILYMAAVSQKKAQGVFDPNVYVPEISTVHGACSVTIPVDGRRPKLIKKNWMLLWKRIYCKPRPS